MPRSKIWTNVTPSDDPPTHTGQKTAESSEEKAGRQAQGLTSDLRRLLCSAARSAQQRAEMPKLFLNLFRTRDRLGDFFAQQLAVALPHSMHGGLNSGFGHSKFDAKVCVRPSARLTWLIVILQVEKCGLSTRCVFLAQAGQSRLQDRLRPSTFEDRVRRQMIDGLGQVTCVIDGSTERYEELAAATLLGACFAALFG